MYTAEISRKEPTLFVFAVDGSGSTSRTLANSQESIAQRIALALNRLIFELVVRSTKGEDEVRDYYEIAALVYNGNGVQSGWVGALAGKEIAKISDLAKSPARLEERKRKVDDGAGGLIEVSTKVPVWFEASPSGTTPMCEAFARAKALMQSWIAAHPNAYPPALFNVSDGGSTDGDPTALARELQALTTSDGSVLVYNLNVSPTATGEVLYPADDNNLDADGRTLFAMSSEMPPHIAAALTENGTVIKTGARCCTINADMVQIVQALNIGTRPASLES
ncbi:MAG: VWA domain-containing protein [bacterium]|nr:VWA domain-containing protein [bacterium]